MKPSLEEDKSDEVKPTPAPEEKQEQKQAEDTGGDWFIFERHMREKDEDFVKTLNPPATEKDIREAEKTMNLKFPADYEKLLKIHDGQNDDAKALFGRYMFSPLSEVMKAHDENSTEDNPEQDKEIDADKGVVQNAWNKGWIPFAIAPGGDALVIDTAPDEDGNEGQIISFYKADNKREVVAKDLGTWLGDFIKEELGEVKRAPTAVMEGWFGPKKEEAPQESNAPDVRKDFERLLAHFKSTGKDPSGWLRPPATANEIADAEKKLGVKLPGDYIELLKIANGQKSGTSLFNGFGFLAIQEVANYHLKWLEHKADWKAEKTDADKGVKPVWYSDGWVGFAELGNGDYLCIDFDPAPGGTLGQIIEFTHDDDHRALCGKTFADWLNTTVNTTVKMKK